MAKKKLQSLLKEVEIIEIKGIIDIEISGVAIDSRNISRGFLFAALKGAQSDGHQFVKMAIYKGATVVLCEEMPVDIVEGVTYVKVSNARKEIGKIASAYFDHPSHQLKVVGVTGTNGKTSIATLLYSLFKEMGYQVGLISTIEIKVNEEKWKAQLTTPDVISLQELLHQMVESGCTHAFMEVSSHAVDQDRISGLRFAGGVFTNLSHDHLDYHKTFAAYIKAKQGFFDALSKDAFAIVNIDDRNGEVMVEHCDAQVYKYSQWVLTDYKFKVLSEAVLGMQLEINGVGFMTRMAGVFNAYNLTAVYAVTDLLTEDIEQEELIEKLSNLQSAKGRMEIVAQQPRVVVDYSHTPDALDNALRTLKKSVGRGRLICVVGCGGDRDAHKRPVMAKVSVRLSDLSIFTSDNPRSEDPEHIIEDMMKGLTREEAQEVLEIVDRKAAIKTALKMSEKHDTILIAGKGHEDYQEVNGQRHFFSDQQIVKDILSKHI